MNDIVDKIAEGIHRITLPLPLDDLTTINAYAVESRAGLVLIDPGWATDANENALITALRELGYSLRDVTTTIATHAHWDHYTQALKIRDEHGCRLYLGRQEHHSIDAFEALTGVYPRQVELLRQAGASELAAAIDALRLERYEEEVPFGRPDVWLDDDDAIDLGDRVLSIHATPGHTRGHVVIEDRESGVLFTGDHILPRITPSVGFERQPEDSPLTSFLRSLDLMLTLPDGKMLPAHGAVSPSVHARAQGLLDHHAERLRTIQQIAAGGRSPYEVACDLPWTRHRRRLSELTPVHQMVAVLEVAAHMAVAERAKV
jgi:glyoxylase-like metal-dependent hydrolase (beta-lactamase superfamily II)